MDGHPNWQLSGLQSEPNSTPRPGEGSRTDPTTDTASTIPGTPAGVGVSPFANETVDTVRTAPREDRATAVAADIPAGPGGGIALVREGMKVVDASGKEVGTVDQVKMGDPQAATTRGEEIEPTPQPSWLSASVLGMADDTPPEALRAEMLRLGFVHIDSKGWFSKNRVALPDQIAAVEGDRVLLSVPADQLAAD